MAQAASQNITTNFRRGQKVTLRWKAVGWRRTDGKPRTVDPVFPEFGTVYTISEIVPHGFGIGLRFKEIPCAVGATIVTFSVKEFRLVAVQKTARKVARKTELPACLTALLNPANHRPIREPAFDVAARA